MRVDAARLRRIGCSAGDGLQAQYFVPRPRPQRNAIGAACAGLGLHLYQEALQVLLDYLIQRRFLAAEGASTVVVKRVAFA